MRGLIALPALLATLALLLAACPQDEPVVEDDPTPTPVPTPSPTPDELALEQSCDNEDVGFTIDYPTDWVTNEADGLPACSAFDPDDVGLPDAAEIPTSIAVVLREEPIAFADVTDFDGDPTVEALAVEDATVDGRAAVVVELEHTGDGLYPEGTLLHAWYVDLDGATLVATTFDVDEAGPPGFERRTEVLDAMMGSLRFADGATG